MQQPGDLIGGKYRLLQELGRGGFGLTFLAEDLNLSRQLVVKVPNRAMRNEDIYDKFLRRFKREGESLAKLRHSHVVRVIEFVEDNQIPCLVMEYVEGQTLEKWVKQRGKLPPEVAVKQFRELAEALHYVHQRELIHCDIKPENLIRSPEGNLILIDFGSTKLLTEHSTTVTTATTQGYAPYEAILGGYKAAATLDVYSLAATLYFAVTGQKPVGAMERKLAAAPLPPPQDLGADVPSWLNQAILKGMALEPGDRPNSMQLWLGSPHPPQPKAQNPSSQQRKSPQNKAIPYSALFVLALGYLPTGLVLVLSNHLLNIGWAEAWVLAGTGAWVCALTGFDGWALAGIGALGMVVMVGAMAGALAMAMAGALAWALALAGTGGALALAGTGGLGLWLGLVGLGFGWGWDWGSARRNGGILLRDD